MWRDVSGTVRGGGSGGNDGSNGSWIVVSSDTIMGTGLMDTDMDMVLMRMEFFYTWKTTIFTFLCILALSTAYSRTGYTSTQGYTSTTQALSDVTVACDWSLFL